MQDFERHGTRRYDILAYHGLNIVDWDTISADDRNQYWRMVISRVCAPPPETPNEPVWIAGAYYWDD
jgi:hypothetical protein